MSTFMPKARDIKRTWYILDAAGKPLGRTAERAAYILRGKHKPIFTPNIDCGDSVIILNAEKAILTGNKATQKFYRHHSGWVGGLKETAYKDMMKYKPEFTMSLAVKGMLPSNTLGAHCLTRLRVYRGEEHTQQAQKPVAWTQG
ncbi:MAG: 50S ribosomal protein L13 [Acetanaerobacterium sp.]